MSHDLSLFGDLRLARLTAEFVRLRLCKLKTDLDFNSFGSESSLEYSHEGLIAAAVEFKASFEEDPVHRTNIDFVLEEITSIAGRKVSLDGDQCLRSAAGLILDLETQVTVAFFRFGFSQCYLVARDLVSYSLGMDSSAFAAVVRRSLLEEAIEPADAAMMDPGWRQVHAALDKSAQFRICAAAVQAQKLGKELQSLLSVDLDNLERELDDEFSRTARNRRSSKYSLGKAPLKRKRPRKAATSGLPPLTPAQVEAVQLVAEHKGSFTAAGKAAGKSRQAMGKLYKKANRKLGSAATKRLRTQALPTDKRGQANVADPDAIDMNAPE